MKEKEYKVVNDTSYDSRTPDDLVRLLEKVRLEKMRIVIVYGDVETCKPWEEVIANRGRIGRSSGSVKIPILIKTDRSMGGEGILDHCIIQIKESLGGKVLYDRKHTVS